MPDEHFVPGKDAPLAHRCAGDMRDDINVATDRNGALQGRPLAESAKIRPVAVDA